MFESNSEIQKQFLNFVFLFNCHVEFSNFEFVSKLFPKAISTSSSGYFFQPTAAKAWARDFGLKEIFWVVFIFSIHSYNSNGQNASRRMRDIFSQKITYEKISAILQAKKTYKRIRGYSVNSVIQFCKKMEFLPGSFNTMWEQWFLKWLQRFKRASTKFTFSINRVYSFCESFQRLLTFWILVDKMNVFLSFSSS